MSVSKLDFRFPLAVALTSFEMRSTTTVEASMLVDLEIPTVIGMLLMVSKESACTMILYASRASVPGSTLAVTVLAWMSNTNPPPTPTPLVAPLKAPSPWALTAFTWLSAVTSRLPFKSACEFSKTE